MRLIPIMLSLAFLLSSTASHAHYEKVVSGWAFKSEPHGCLAVYRLWEERLLTEISVTLYPSGHDVFNIERDRWDFEQSALADVSLSIGDRSLKTRATNLGDSEKGWAKYFASTDADSGIFRQQIQSVSIIGGESAVALRFPLNDAVVEAAQQCRVYVAQDPSARANSVYIATANVQPTIRLSGQAKPPVPRRQERWIRWDDYPSRAIREEREGSAAFLVSINDRGRVTECEITATSGHQDLDEITCREMRRRARFHPAMDYLGNAVESSYSGYSVFGLPSGDHDPSFHDSENAE